MAVPDALGFSLMENLGLMGVSRIERLEKGEMDPEMVLVEVWDDRSLRYFWICNIVLASVKKRI